MYQGSYARKPSKPRRSRVRMNKTAVLLLAVILLAGAVIGTTVAYLTTNTSSLTNNFTYANVTCEVKEDFDGNTKSKVQILNTSNIPVYIRATYVVYWADAAGNVVTTVPTGYSYSISESPTAPWVMGTDGYYYYPTPVQPDKATTGSLVECTWTHPDNPEYFLHVEIIASAIQSEPANAVTEAWGIAPPFTR